jgi:phytoene synthase
MDLDIDKIANENSKSNFYYSFLFLPKRKREAINLLYSFCQVADTIADSNSPIEVKIKTMIEFKKELKLCFEGKSNITLLNKLAIVTKEFSINQSLLFELLEGMDMDLNNKEYKSFLELEIYCYKVASVVGLMSSKIFGYEHKETEQYAITLGKALQLTNILRDIKSDCQMGRIYIPQDDLDSYGISADDIKKEKFSNEFKSLLKHYYNMTLNYYNCVEQLINKEDRKNFYVARIMKNIYFAILRKIEKQNFDVFKGKFKLSKFQKLYIALKTVIFDK